MRWIGERHLFGDTIQEEQGIARVSARVNAQNSKARAVIDRRVLIHAWRELHRVHLHAIARDRPAVAPRHMTAFEPDQRFDVRCRQDLVDGRQREFRLSNSRSSVWIRRGHRCLRRVAAESSNDLDPLVCDSGCDEDVCLPIEALALRVPRSASPTYAASAVRHHTASTPARRYPFLGAFEPNASAE